MNRVDNRISAFKIFYDEFVYKENNNISYALIDRNIANIRDLTMELRKTSKADLDYYAIKLDRINKRIREQLNEMYKLNESLFEYFFLLYKSCVEVCNDKLSDMPFLICCAFYEDYRLDNKTPLELESSKFVVPKYTSQEKKKIRNEAKGLTKVDYFINLVNSSNVKYKSFNNRMKDILSIKPKLNETNSEFITRVENRLDDYEGVFVKLENKAKLNDDYERISEYMEIVFRKKFVDWPKEIKRMFVEFFDLLYKKLKESSELRGCFNLANDISFESFRELTAELVKEKEKYMKDFESGKFVPVEFLDDSYISKFKENLINNFFDIRYINKISFNPTIDECVARTIELYALGDDLSNQIFERIMYEASHSPSLKRNNDVRNAILNKIYDLYNPVYLLAIFDKTRNSFETILERAGIKTKKEYVEKIVEQKKALGYHGPLPSMKTIKMKILERRKNFIIEHCLTELKSKDVLGNYDTRNYDLGVVARDIEINEIINLYELIKYKINSFDYSSLNFYNEEVNTAIVERENTLKAAQEFVVKDIFAKLKIKALSLEDLNNRYRDICYSYLNEDCIFVFTESNLMDDEEKSKFLEIRDKFNMVSKWNDFIVNNKLNVGL